MQLRHPRRSLEQTEAERADLRLLAQELAAQGRTVRLSPRTSPTCWLRVECPEVRTADKTRSVCRRAQWEELVARGFWSVQYADARARRQ